MLRRKNNNKEIDISTRIIEDVLKTSGQQIQSVDPKTEMQWQRLKNAIAVDSVTDENSSVISRWFLPQPAIAFVVAVVLLITFSIIWLRDSSPIIYETTKGEHSSIVLHDSTEIILNSTSMLTVNKFNQESIRYVALRGEALFHVRRIGKPFVLTTDIGIVEVLGTHFNVRARDEKMEVAVLSGSVKVRTNKDGKDSSIVLEKGQIVICRKNQFPESPNLNPFPDYPGWTHGKLMFYRTSLASVCKELESQFDIKIKIENEQAITTTLTGIINNQNTEAALTTLAELTGKKYRYENQSYIIY